MKKLGVLGGMGPAASAEFMVRLTAQTPADRDQDHIPTVLWSDPRVPDRSTSLRNGDNDPLDWLILGIEGLQQAGCDYIVIPCNTAHFWYDELVALGTPIIHIVDSVADRLRSLEVVNTTIGVMGTRATIDLELYQHLLGQHGWACIIPSHNEMESLVQPAINLIKGNRITEAYPLLIKVVRSLVARGANAVVLGCTEIPLAIREDTDQGIPLVNSIDSLVTSVIQLHKQDIQNEINQTNHIRTIIN